MLFLLLFVLLKSNTHMDKPHTGVNSSITMYCANDEGNARYERSESNETYENYERYERSERCEGSERSEISERSD
jgi:hypothetical protein